jgi:predicted nucleotidyltransferase
MSPAETAGEVARRIAAAYAELPEVVAVALGGSQATGAAGAGSDVDLYVYARPEPSLAARAAVARGGSRLELGNRAFEPGDEWVDGASGVHVDAMFRDPAWIEDELDRVLVLHEPRTGWSTAVWHGVRASRPLFDRDGWYARLKARAEAPYPEPLARAIVRRNAPLLARSLSSFTAQLEKAVRRGDAVSVCHRTAALLASAFDVLFAVNREPHPGEKRLLEHARRCLRRPPGFEADLRALLAAAAAPGPEVVERARSLARGLDALAAAEGLLEPEDAG